MKYDRSQTAKPHRFLLILFGLFLCIVLLEVGLRAGGFILTTIQERSNLRSLKEKGEYVILCLGESTTAMGGADSWPSQLEEILDEGRSGLRFNVVNRGIPGTNTGVIIAKLEEELDRYNPDLVVAMMGINDTFSKSGPEGTDGGEKEAKFVRSLRVFKLVEYLQQRILDKLNGRLATLSVEEETTGEFRFEVEREGRQPEALNIFPKEGSRPKEVETTYKEAISSAPYSSHLYVYLGDWYQKRGEYRKARRYYRKAMEIEPWYVRWHGRLAKSYRSERELDKARLIYRNALALDPMALELYSGLGDCYLDEKEMDKALEVYREALDETGNKDWFEVKVGNWHRTQRNNKEAEASYRKALELNPRNWPTYVELGRLKQEEGNWKEAIDWYEQALNVSASNVWFQDNLPCQEIGDWYKEQGDLRRANKFYDQVTEVKETEADDFYFLGAWYGEQGNNVLKEEMLKRAVESAPEIRWPYVSLLDFYVAHNRWEEAEGIMEIAAAELPDTRQLALALADFAKSYQMNEKHEEAIRLYRKVLDLAPLIYTPVYLRLGQCYRLLGKFTMAEAMLKKELENNPNAVAVMSELAMICCQQGRWQEAEACYLNIFSTDTLRSAPELYGAFYQLVDYYIAAGKLDKAISLCWKLVNTQPDNQEGWQTLARSYRLKGEHKTANEYLRKADELKPSVYDTFTARNYRKLRKIVEMRGKQLICVQYPIRELDSLIDMFDKKDGLLFVDNENMFKKAVRAGGYSLIFTDRFAGNFGHCTRKGNRLLAENIADTILEQIDLTP